MVNLTESESLDQQIMDLSNDPEIICVFCGIGFSSVETVEQHIHDYHQSNNVDQIESRKISVTDNTNENSFSSHEKTEINLIDFSNDKELDHPQKYNKVVGRRFLEKKYCQSDRKSKTITHLAETKADFSTDTKNLSVKKRIIDPMVSVAVSEREILKSTKKVNNKTKPIYKCTKCYKRFLKNRSRKIHLYIHKVVTNRKWNCKNCGFWYSTRQILQNHIDRQCTIKHSSNSFSSMSNKNKLIKESHVCQFCKMMFIDHIYLEMHQIKVCQRILSRPGNEKSQLIDKSNSESIVGEGEQSSKKTSRLENNGEFSIKKELSSKICFNDYSISSNESSLWQSDILDRKLNSGTSELYFHHYKNKVQQKSFQCKLCNKKFSCQSSLSNHIKSHYSSQGQPFTCRDCNKQFVNLLSLQDHRRATCSQKSKENEQKVICNLSNFNGVSQVPIWSNIINPHSGTQPVTCLHCNGVFYDRLELEEHALLKHSNEHGNILCLLCDRSFTTNMALRVHLTKSHGFANGGCPGVSQNLPPMPKLETNYFNNFDFPVKRRRKEKRLCVNNNQYLCDNCHKSFSTSQALGNHRRACLNLSKEFVTVESKSLNPNYKPNSKLHSIESIIFDNANMRPSFKNDKNVFLVFN